MGFDVYWVRLSMACVTSITYAININGKVARWIKPSRRLRQGDPLSPYLFIVVADVFPQMISEVVASRTLKRIKLGRACLGLSRMCR